MNGAFVVLYFLGVGTVGTAIGFSIGNSGSKRLLAGRWALGMIIVAAVIAILFAIGQTAACATFGLNDDYDLVIQSADKCDGAVVGWYAVLTAWQAGIGATLALLGLAWAAYFNRSVETPAKLNELKEEIVRLRRELEANGPLGRRIETALSSSDDTPVKG